MVVPARATVAEARATAAGAGADLVVLVHDGELLAGTVSLQGVDERAGADAPVETVADLDPPATRPDVTGKVLLDRMRGDDLPWVAVTTATGRFLGVVDGHALAALARADRLP